MAKDQNLSLNSMKISGPCGRLLCCLAYEHLFYSEQRRHTPQEGARINREGALWKVQEVNVVMGQVKLVSEEGSFLQLPSSAFEKSEGRWQIREQKAPPAQGIEAESPEPRSGEDLERKARSGG